LDDLLVGGVANGDTGKGKRGQQWIKEKVFHEWLPK